MTKRAAIDRYVRLADEDGLTGRVKIDLGGERWASPYTSRLHGASISGLVVGAMGCFIFGLYLRGWLRERKALARAPGQDMIA